MKKPPDLRTYRPRKKGFRFEFQNALHKRKVAKWMLPNTYKLLMWLLQTSVEKQPLRQGGDHRGIGRAILLPNRALIDIF